jgi:tetratricopeptide (TPR) repeat protein
MRMLIALLVVVGCSKHEDKPAPAPATPPPPTAAADAAPVRDYDALMKSGAALEDKKQWAEALADFEAAAKAKPDDARALDEVAFTAYFAGKLDRAKEAALAAIAAAKDDKKLRAVALFNLGLAIEKTQPAAALALYVESDSLRPNRVVHARAAKLGTPKPSADDAALLAKVNVKPAPLEPAKPNASKVDDELMAALTAAGIDWDCGAGKCVQLVENLECKENHQVKPTTYECTTPAVKGAPAKALIGNLLDRKIAPAKEHGDMVTYKASSVRCRSFNEGDSGQPDECEVKP